MEQILLSDFFTGSKAYFIAINRYVSPSVEDLSSPLQDITVLKNVLETYHDFKFESVEFINEQGQHIILNNPLVDPGSVQVKDFLSNIKTNSRDRVIIYFAGHGIASNNDDEPEGYLLAADANPPQWDTYIKMKEVREWIDKLECSHLLIILDCCYAGAFRWTEKSRSPFTEVPKTIYYERFRQYAINKAIQLITSSAHDQKAIDTLGLGKRDDGPEVTRLSPFAEILIRGLEKGAADMSYGSTPADGVITASELGFYLRQEVSASLYSKGIEVNKQQVAGISSLLKDSKGEFVFISPAAQRSSNGGIPLKNKTNRNPYKGLEAYQVSDDKIFYGRQRVLDGWEHVQGLKQTVSSSQVTIVTGPSGIGKSSLVKAGILSLYDIKDREQLRPGKTPANSLDELLIKNPGVKILLIDQYEELVTICDGPLQRELFEEKLLKLSVNCKVIITIRSDFESQFKNIFQYGYRFVVPPFTREEIEEVIAQPALQEVLEFKARSNTADAGEKFMNRIVDEAYQNPGSLPLLSLALSELYESKEDSNLLEMEYNKFGGITGILDKKATEEFEKCGNDANRKEFFRQLIFRMISFESGQMAKRKIYTSLNPGKIQADDELAYTDSRDTIAIKEIAVVLVEARLLKMGTDEDENRRSFIEPAHEALLNSWSLLLEWLKEKNEKKLPQTSRIQLHRDVADISLSYKHADESRIDYLWIKDPRLLLTQQQIQERLNNTEAVFIADSYHKKRSIKKRNTGIVIAISAVILFLCVFLFIKQQQASAEALKNKALFLASESDKYGQTEKLAMLKKAYDVYKDSSIENKIAGLLNTYDYFDPFAIAKFDTKDSIESISYANNGEALLISGKTSRQKWNIVQDSTSPMMPNEKSGEAFIVSTDERNIYVVNTLTKRTVAIKDRTLFGSSVDTAGNFIYLLVSDSLFYYSIRLDSNTSIVFNHKLTDVPHDYTNWNYFKENGYYVIDSSEYNRLYDPEGKRIDSYIPGINAIGVHIFNNKVAVILREAETGRMALVSPRQKNRIHWLAGPNNFSYYYTTIINSYSLKDSLFLFEVNNPPREGPGGQSTDIFTYDFKNGKYVSLVETFYVFNTFELSPDKKLAIATSETDSFYYINIEKRIVETKYYKDLEKAVFIGNQDMYCVITKSTGGYTTTVFDSSIREINRIEYSYFPKLFSLSPDNKFLSICFGYSSVLTWRLNKPFNSKPWGEKLNNETSYGSFVVNDLLISNSGLFIAIDATVEAGTGLNKVYYINDLLQTNQDEHYSQYILLPREDSVLEYIDNTNVMRINCISIQKNKITAINNDTAKQVIMNTLTENKVPVTVKLGVVNYITSDHRNIAIDSFERMISQWGSGYFMDGNALIYQYGISDTSFTIYEAGNEPHKNYKKGRSPIYDIAMQKENAAYDFIYGAGKEGKLFREKARYLTGYNFESKDSLKGFTEKGNQLLYSENGVIMIAGGTVYLFDSIYSGGVDVVSPGNIIAASLYNDGKGIILVGQDGTIYLKRTKKYLDWFLRNGYTIPLGKEVLNAVKM